MSVVNPQKPHKLTLKYIFTKYILLGVLCVCVEERWRGCHSKTKRVLRNDANIRITQEKKD